jgi:folate-binding protein YgfZ
MVYWTWAKDRLCFRITGQGVLDFLQGLITADLRCFSDPISFPYHPKDLQSFNFYKPALWSAFLTPQGRFMADFFVVLYEKKLEKESVIIECHESYEKNLIQRLAMLGFRRSIAFEPLPHHKVFLIFSHNPQDILGQNKGLPHHRTLKKSWMEDLENHCSSNKEILSKDWALFCDPRNAFLSSTPEHTYPLGHRLILPVQTLDLEENFAPLTHLMKGLDPLYLSKNLTQTPTSDMNDHGDLSQTTTIQHQSFPLENYRLYTMSWGIADAQDLEIQRSIILEYGYHHLGALSWEKGCYLGQELMARSYHRGLIRKKICILKRTESPFPCRNSPLRLGGDELGIMKTSLEDYGLALMYSDKIDLEKIDTLLTDLGNFSIQLPSFYPVLPKH